MVYKLDTKYFKLELSVQTFDDVFPCPNDSILKIYVYSSEFSGNAEIDIGLRDFALFTEKLKYIYDNLKGEAEILEAYSDRKIINFKVNKTGQIVVSGVLSCIKNSLFQEIKFENIIEPSLIKKFVYDLFNDYKKFINVY